MKTRVVLMDDHRVVGRSLRAYLESFADLEVVGVAVSGEELLRSIAGWRADVAICDLLLPGGMDGVETIRRLREVAPGVRAIALTASIEEARMVGALRAGAAGYVRKDAEPEVLLQAVRVVARGGRYFDVDAAHRQVDGLTEREGEVVRQLALGRSNKEIAEALGIGDETVKSHVSAVLGKLGAENRAQAIVAALKRGLVALEELE